MAISLTLSLWEDDETPIVPEVTRPSQIDLPRLSRGWAGVLAHKRRIAQAPRYIIDT